MLFARNLIFEAQKAHYYGLPEQIAIASLTLVRFTSTTCRVPICILSLLCVLWRYEFLAVSAFVFCVCVCVCMFIRMYLRVIYTCSLCA